MAADGDHLVGDFIRYEHQFHTKDATDLGRRIGIARATVYRLFAGDPTIKAPTWRKAEVVLEIPEDSLDMIRDLNLPELHRAGMPERPMRWLRKRLEPTVPGNGDLTVERGRGSVTVRDASARKDSAKGSRSNH